jgi:hypothetical protein
MAKNRKEEVENAKLILKKYGYYTDNLWHIDDVMNNYDCDEDTAMDILHSTMRNDATIEQIWFSMDVAADVEGVEKL